MDSIFSSINRRELGILSPEPYFSGDRVAADAVGLGIIKSFGKWPMVTEKDVWEQKQIKRALELGIGARKENLKLVVGKGGEEFKRVIERVRGLTGIP